MRENKAVKQFQSAPTTTRLPIDSIALHDARDRLAELAFTRNSARVSFDLLDESLFLSLRSHKVPVHYRPRFCRYAMPLRQTSNV